MRRAILALAVLSAACSAAGEPGTTNPTSAVPCQNPPQSELAAASALEMRVDPNPATAMETVSLTVASRDLPSDALTGVDARWQCWDGSQWVTTHAVYRGFGDNPGQTIPLNSEFQIRVPSIGLDLDEGFLIVIPRVEPGSYRIEDEVILGDESRPGHVIVEVVED